MPLTDFACKVTSTHGSRFIPVLLGYRKAAQLPSLITTQHTILVGFLLRALCSVMDHTFYLLIRCLWTAALCCYCSALFSCDISVSREICIRTFARNDSTRYWPPGGALVTLALRCGFAAATSCLPSPLATSDGAFADCLTTKKTQAPLMRWDSGKEAPHCRD